jgi:hypothetical protein
VKPESSVAVVDLNEHKFRTLLEECVGRYATAPEPESDLIFLGVESTGDLGQIESLVQYLRPNGHIWVVAPKGRHDIREIDVLQVGRAAGLKDTKVASFSVTHTAHRFTIPLERR